MIFAISALAFVLALICAYRLGYDDGRYHEIAEESFRKLDRVIDRVAAQGEQHDH